MPSSPPAAPLPLTTDFPVGDDAQWRALVEKVLKGADFRKRLVSRTADGIEIEPLYTRENGRENGDSSDFRASAPGSKSTAHETELSPFSPAAHSGGWRIAQVRPETTPESFAAAALADIEGGADALTIRLAASGQTGLPADVASLEAALGPLPLDRVKIALEPGANAIDGARTLVAIATKRNALRCIGRLGIDPLGTLARTGVPIALPDLAGSALLAPSAGALLTADSRPYHEAGASEAQEIAALAATLVAYLRSLEAAGLQPELALQRIALTMAADADIVLTIAKLRAARRVVTRIGQACGAGDAAGLMHLAVTTSERMMARRDPWVNLLRVTSACTAAAIGGADEIAVLPHTWALGAPDAFASRVARNVGLVLREEAGLGRIADPAGGAWAVERLTDELAAKAWGIFQEWEREGGMQAALVSGLVHDRIGAVADARAKDIATRRIELTGVSAFPQLTDAAFTAEPWLAPPPLPASPLARVLKPVRLAAPFEALRDAADRAAVRPRVFLAALGSAAEHTSRSMWMTNLLAAGGIAVIASDRFTSSADAGRAFAESGATVACICGTDQGYAELAEATAMALKGAGARHLLLAGRPREQEAALKAAGVDTFLSAGIDTLAALSAIQRELGIE